MGDREVSVRLRADIADFQRKMAEASASAKVLERDLNGSDKSVANLGKSSQSTSKEVDKLSGRLTILRDAAILATPAVVEIGAEGAPLIAGLVAEFGAAALAAGTAVLAFRGVGTALKAVNTAALNPTTQNLEKAHQAMAMLSPAARDLVKELRNLQPTIDGLSASAASGFFPGLIEGMKALQTAAPQVDAILVRIGHTMGNLAADAGKSLAGPEWAGFIQFITREGPPALSALGHSIGQVTHGLAELVMAGAPLEHLGTGWLSAATEGFDKWATGLAKTQGFHEFVNYVEEHGPEVGQALAAVSNALLQIVEASSGLGGPTLQAITALANVVAKLADSKAGPAILATASALALLSRTQAAFASSSSKTNSLISAANPFASSSKGASSLSATLMENRAALVKTGAAAAGFGLAISGATQKSQLLNVASMALMGSVAGPWGAAFGAGVGILEAFAGGQAKAVTDAATLTSTLDQQTGAITQNTAAYVAKQFADSGVLKNAQSLGISLQDVTQAALGNKDALARVNQQGAAYQKTLDGNVPKLSAFADTFSTVTNAIGDTSGQLTDSKGKLSLVSSAMGSYSHSVMTAAQANQAQTKAINQANQAMRDQVDAALAAFDAETQYRQALKEAEAQAKKSNAGIKGSSDAAIQNRNDLSALASAWNNQSTAVQNNVGKYKEMRGQFISTAEAMGVPEGAAKRLADTILHIPRSVVAKVTVDAAEAQAAIQKILAGIASIHGKTAYIDIVTRRHGAGGQGGGYAPSADGSTVPKDGKPYADRYLYMLAPGEEVISNRNGQADRHRALLKQINAGGMAGGGTAGGSNGGGNGSNLFFIAGVDGSLKGFKSALDAASKTLDSERQARAALTQQEKDYASTVGAAFAKADLFSGDLSTFDTGVQANTNDTQSAQMALATAVGNGLSGPLEQALASSGNLSLLQQFAGLTPAQIAQREAQFAAQNNAENTLGSSAASMAGFPQLLRDATRQIHEDAAIKKTLEHTVKALTAELKHLGSNVQAGARAGVGDKSQHTRNHVRAGT